VKWRFINNSYEPHYAVQWRSAFKVTCLMKQWMGVTAFACCGFKTNMGLHI